MYLYLPTGNSMTQLFYQNKKMLYKKNIFNRGVTLIELVVVVAIVAVVTIAIATFQKDVFSLNASLQGSLNAQLEGSHVMRKMVGELRSASPSGAGAYPIAQAATSTVTFYADIDDDNLKEKVRYFMQGKLLRRGITEPTGNPTVYTSTEKIETLVSDVINTNVQPIFYYYDSTYNGVSGAALTVPINALLVRLVKINVIIDRDVNRPPGPITVTSQVSLRNIKDNL